MKKKTENNNKKLEPHKHRTKQGTDMSGTQLTRRTNHGLRFKRIQTKRASNNFKTNKHNNEDTNEQSFSKKNKRKKKSPKNFSISEYILKAESN